MLRREPQKALNVHVQVPTLPTRRYLIKSFYGAVHATTTYAMPQNRSLSEYVTLVTLLAKLIRRLIEHLQSQAPSFTKQFLSTSIGLLVGHVEGHTTSMARIGFSAHGTPEQRSALIRERRQNLPELASISGKVGWESGNCAEAEMFGHLRCMRQMLSESCPGEPDIVFVSLTLKLFRKSTKFGTSSGGKKMCSLCCQLADKLSSATSCPILDLYPS
jgi:hypothetical protein